MKIAIIGTAGRDADGDKLSRDSFGEMFLSVKSITKRLSNGQPWTAVSGGAAWADHIAVFSFGLGFAEKLHLELPCELGPDGKFMDTHERDFKKNPGGTANFWHKKFSDRVGIDSFKQLRSAADNENCVVSVGKGFFDRNGKIATKADACIALTFGNEGVLQDGGTADTMKKFLKKGKGVTFHIDLNTMRVYSPAIVK